MSNVMLQHTCLKMTKEERFHYGRLAQLGCIACRVLGYGFSPCEIHHLRTGVGAGQKADFRNAVGLCHRHHRTGGYGVAIHAGIRGFIKTVGMNETELLNEVNKLLEEL